MLQQLRIVDFRAFGQVEFDPDPGWNLFLGANGAGKTSILEAAFLLSHGRSFRTALKDALVRRGASAYSIFGRLATSPDEAAVRVGLSRGGSGLEARLQGEHVPAADLLRHVAVLCFEPGSHALISGAAEERRRFLDWGVFHVEHGFLTVWRRYQRALKQRNSLLRAESTSEAIDAWDYELAHAAAPLTTMRRDYFEAWKPGAIELLSELLGELGAATLRFEPGYDPESPFDVVLAANRLRDLSRGHTGYGPHRADWSVRFEHAPRREHLSRGQEKLCAFAAIAAQARLFQRQSGTWPILCLDDLASELDVQHQERIVALLGSWLGQVLATGTEEPAAFARLKGPLTRFHVEQGHVTRLL